jgi:hypothetical protein
MNEPCGPRRLTEGNVTHLHPSSGPKLDTWTWMRFHMDWWSENRDRIDWQTMDRYRPYWHEGMSIASPVLLRDDTRWFYGSWVVNEWRRFTEGASWVVENFTPTHWADVDLDAGIMLGQE